MHRALHKVKRFEKRLPLAVSPVDGVNDTLRLRTVDLVQDLKYFYRWMEESDLQVNWGIRENRQRLSKHYQLFLESDNRQSFLVEKSNAPVAQFDIFLIHYHELYFRIPTTTGDCILNYILRLSEDSRRDLKHALRLQLDYFFSSPECRRLWVPIPETQEWILAFFEEAGFRYKASYTARQQRYALLYLKRADYVMGGPNP